MDNTEIINELVNIQIIRQKEIVENAKKRVLNNLDDEKEKQLDSLLLSEKKQEKDFESVQVDKKI